MRFVLQRILSGEVKTIDEFAQAPPVKEFTLVNLYMDAFDEATV